MELQQLRYFVAAAEAGSVSRAAARCHVAQPSLSQQLRKLEEDLGVLLFDRLGRGIAITDAGRAFLPRARRILAEVRDAELNLQNDVVTGVGRLAIGAIPTMAPYILPGALKTLRRKLPACEVSIREDLTESLVEALVDCEIDCALVSTPLDHDLMDIEVLGHEELLVVTAAEHRLAGKGPVTIEDFRDEPTIVLEDMHCLALQTQSFCTGARISPRVVCRTTQLSTIFELVALGLGFSIVPEMAAVADHGSDRRYMRLGRNPPVRQVALAWRRDRTRSRAGEVFRDVVATALRSDTHRLTHSHPKSGSL